MEKLGYTCQVIDKKRLEEGSRPMTKHGCTYHAAAWFTDSYSSRPMANLGYLESSDVFLIQSLNAVVTVPPQPYGRGFFVSKISGSIYLSARLML